MMKAVAKTKTLVPKSKANSPGVAGISKKFLFVDISGKSERRTWGEKVMSVSFKHNIYLQAGLIRVDF